MTDWQKTDKTREPTADSLHTYVSNPLWDGLCASIEADYGVKPLIEFSNCSMLRGWNVKYKKSGLQPLHAVSREGHLFCPCRHRRTGAPGNGVASPHLQRVFAGALSQNSSFHGPAMAYDRRNRRGNSGGRKTLHFRPQKLQKESLTVKAASPSGKVAFFDNLRNYGKFFSASPWPRQYRKPPPANIAVGSFIIKRISDLFPGFLPDGFFR